LEQTVSQGTGTLELSRSALIGEMHSRSDIEQPWNGSSQGGPVKNQCDFQDAANSNNSRGSTFAYLIAGLGIGAALSIFLAPRSGTETRQWIANKCLDGVDTANRTVLQNRRKVKDVLDQGQKKIDEVVEAAREAIGRP
jgi:gas vesicle protein